MTRQSVLVRLAGAVDRDSRFVKSRLDRPRGRRREAMFKMHAESILRIHKKEPVFSAES